MSDETPDKGATTLDNINKESEPQQGLIINLQYVKDLSFEAPATPGVFAMLQKQQPEISLNVNLSVHPAQENMYEVVLGTRAECKLGDTICFIAELDYAGLFTLNIEEQHRQAVLLIECPRLLFPFSRHLMSVVTRDGGFPPLMIGPLDFVSMYKQRLNKDSKLSDNTTIP
jgi:preprotein translocase subunit SecB